ncbi:hypothetical protein EIN_429710 [Entamoeba invadens IP1]|uniref:Uncharacterized protein n=1 Tax=Entamoeba invadens IP1 TaxID=370355 RepID=A0A0A1UF27_ENTIV|nr:hypothetical protein EIN_429710 [Entamoeba invadens IP1]ELP95195.1 hypothetical protein EIN_429710 [Entamoeba invadens IP1]|eukprot:XP_004261966.1 hypothetical protein EIN_429710 [Entamoeba invadens IP1]
MKPKYQTQREPPVFKAAVICNVNRLKRRLENEPEIFARFKTLEEEVNQQQFVREQVEIMLSEFYDLPLTRKGWIEEFNVFMGGERIAGSQLTKIFSTFKKRWHSFFESRREECSQCFHIQGTRREEMTVKQMSSVVRKIGDLDVKVAETMEKGRAELYPKEVKMYLRKMEKMVSGKHA